MNYFPFLFQAQGCVRAEDAHKDYIIMDAVTSNDGADIVE